MAEDPGASLAQLLKTLRVNAGLTQEQLAEAAGVSTRSVSDLERRINRTARRELRQTHDDQDANRGSSCRW